MAARLLHPVQIQIIEAMQWIDRPLSAAELAHIFEDKSNLPEVTYHLRRLAKLKAVALDATLRVRGATKKSYCLEMKPQNSSEGESPEEEATQVERLVLREVLDLHPDHLTIRELILKVAIKPEDCAEAETITHAIQELESSGLLRSIGGVVEPTHAALRASALGL